MKLLLTSGGITNKSIEQTLLNLMGIPADKIRVAFIPTAANVEEGDKGWLIDDMQNIRKIGVDRFDIVEISGTTQDIWLPKLEASNLLFFSGGNTFHLMYWLKKTRLQEILLELLKTRVYAGISAGSMVACRSLALSRSAKLYYEDQGKYDNDFGMGFVPFQVRPHLNSPDFPLVRKELLTQLAKDIPDPIYALDDQSAIVVDGDKTKVVSEGEYLVFNASTS